MRKVAITIGLMVVMMVLRGAWAQTPTTLPAVTYGDANSGLAVGLGKAVSNEGELVVVVRNEGVLPASLEGAFGWLLVVQSREKAFFSEKIMLGEASGGKLEAGAVLVRKMDWQKMRGGMYEKGMKVVQGYPQAGEVKYQELAGMLAGQKCRAQLLVYLPGTPEKMLLKSKAIEMEAGSGKGPKKEIAGGQEEGETITDLVGQFRKDAFAAQAAHAKAVKRGAEMVQPLAEAMKDKSLPDFARMWMATSIIDIGGEGAFDIIIKLVEDQSSGVRNVVAYYGPRLQQEKIDQAIYARADKGEDPLFTAWAARGFATFTKQFPRRLVNAAYASTDPRARAQVADALALSKDAADYLRLAKLFSDENEPVRVSAADAVKQHKIKDSMMLGAMVNSLKLPGEAARERVVDTLAGLTGKTWDYNPDATKEKREKVLREIELWWQLSGGAK